MHDIQVCFSTNVCTNMYTYAHTIHTHTTNTHTHTRKRTHIHTRTVPCSMLQCVAVCCSVLQCKYSCQRTTVQDGFLQCVAVCCSVSKSVAACYSIMQYVTVYCSVLQCVAVCCRVCFIVLSRLSGLPHKMAAPYCVAVRCSAQLRVAECVSVSCSALQCVANVLHRDESCHRTTPQNGCCPACRTRFLQKYCWARNRGEVWVRVEILQKSARYYRVAWSHRMPYLHK